MSRVRVGIIGLGFMGGSLARSIKKRMDVQIWGWDCNEQSIQKAVDLGIVDQKSTSIIEIAQQVDLLFLATPVSEIIQIVNQLAKESDKISCVITDLGSTKYEIVKASAALRQQGILFVGGHPMAGSHLSGIEASYADLFVGTKYILTPTPDVNIDSFFQLSQWLEKATQAQVVSISAEEHDRVVGAISHLPKIVATGLVNQVGDYNEQNEHFLQLAASGFRDTTRIGASNPKMWLDILLTNRDELLFLLDDWITQMNLFRRAIDNQDREYMEQMLIRSQQLRSHLTNERFPKEVAER